jgi:hypothetical protein
MPNQPIITTKENDFSIEDLSIEWPTTGNFTQASVGDSLSQLKAESQKAINISMGVIRAMAHKISRTIENIENDVRPDEVEVEFSIKLELEGGAIVPMVAKTTAGGQFTVTFKWTLDKPQTAHVLVNPGS